MPLRTILCIFLAIALKPCFSQSADKAYKLFFEKVYLHTDREHYAAGEDIWFKAYLVNGQSHQLFNSSNNLYVELISPDSKIAERKVIRLDNGLGNGDFTLGDSIPGGAYRIRAYTNWMRNFGDNFIFEKQIQVYNDTEKLAKAVELDSKKQKSKKSVAPPLQPSTQNLKPILRFFPEGGSIIEGVAGIVAFKAEDASGNGIVAKGSIVSSSGQLLTDFETNELGMGLAMLTPIANETYYAKGSFSRGGGSFNSPLPQPLLNGFSMNVRTRDSLLKITISTNASTFSQVQNKELTLLFKSRGKVYFTTSIKLSELQTAVSISRSGFPSGISSITLYDSDGKPQCERLVYNEGNEKAFLTIASDKVVYSPKGKVTLTLEAKDQSGKPLKANLSLAAVDAELVPGNENNIISYLNLRSEIRGKIEKAGQYFDERNSKRIQQLDLLLLTQGWRDYTWKRLADSALRITYAIEQGITVSGRVREVAKNKPVAGSNITLFAPGTKGSSLFSATTNAEGRYYIDAVPLYGTQNIRITSRDSKGEKNGMILLDSLYQKPPKIETLLTPKADTSEALSDPTEIAFLKKKNNLFRLSDTIQLKEVKIAASKYVRLMDQIATSFGYPEETFNVQPEDSTYQSLEHYLKVNLRHNNSIFMAGINPDGYTKISLPRLFVNGKELSFRDETDGDVRMMMDIYGTYFSLTMDKVAKVVAKHLLGQAKSYYWVEMPLVPDTMARHAGEQYLRLPKKAGGGNEDLYLLYITLKPGAMDYREYDRIVANLTGYSMGRIFYTPDNNSLHAKPDLRTTIYWEPNITTNESGEASVSYYNADPKTKIRIVAEGITSTGGPLEATAGYEVK